MIAVLLPEAGLVLLEELEPGDPFRALPEIEMRYQQPDRPAVLRREGLAIVMGSGGSRCNWDGGSCPALGFAQAAPLIVVGGTGLGMMIGSQMRQWRWVQVR